MEARRKNKNHYLPSSSSGCFANVFDKKMALLLSNISLDGFAPYVHEVAAARTGRLMVCAGSIWGIGKSPGLV
jgi:hypothetical protein